MSMIINNKQLELKQIYDLFSQDNVNLKHIGNKMDEYIKFRGANIYNNKDLIRDPLSIIIIVRLNL